MSFNSFEYAIFLPIVFTVYWVLPKKYQWVVLLISSYFFYMRWNIKYTVLIFGVTCISYLSAILMQKYKERKKIILIGSVFLFIGVLFYFKYLQFALDIWDQVLNAFSINHEQIFVNVILPVGISFYIFQSIGYMVDAYREKISVEKHFGKYAAFVSFFPQLVAGPIERTDNLLPQIKEPRKFSYEQATYGLKLIVWGLFKKMVIADMSATTVDNIYNNLHLYKGFSLIVATVLFGAQIYCDFSGYSDIAIGSAKLLGIDLMTNFKSPYFATSVKEFWSRWHISLSTWFRDYLYIPLGGNRKGNVRKSINLMITFVVSGLWHGANITFVMWGLIHGILQVIENCIKPRKIKIINNVVVFMLVSFAWLFFRAQSLDDAIYIISNALSGIGHISTYIEMGINDLDFNTKIIMTYAISIGILFIYDGVSLKKDVLSEIGKLKTPFRWLLYVAFIWLIILLVPVKGSTEFVYFQF